MKNMCNGKVNDIHISRMKFHYEGSVDKKVLKSLVFSCKTGMIFYCLVHSVDCNDDELV